MGVRDLIASDGSDDPAGDTGSAATERNPRPRCFESHALSSSSQRKYGIKLGNYSDQSAISYAFQDIIKVGSVHVHTAKEGRDDCQQWARYIFQANGRKLCGKVGRDSPSIVNTTRCICKCNCMGYCDVHCSDMLQYFCVWGGPASFPIACVPLLLHASLFPIGCIEWTLQPPRKVRLYVIPKHLDRI